MGRCVSSWGEYNRGSGDVELGLELLSLVRRGDVALRVRKVALFELGFVLDGRPNVLAPGALSRVELKDDVNRPGSEDCSTL